MRSIHNWLTVANKTVINNKRNDIFQNHFYYLNIPDINYKVEDIPIHEKK